MMKNKGLYIHIPFCTHICSYCDFTKVLYNEEIANKYLKELAKEMESYQIHDITSIYIGGGTPTSLNDNLLEELLVIVSKYKTDEVKSFALEGNIENLTLSKIKILKKYGVNRISLGVQSFDDQLLFKMNRHHNKDDVVRVINDLVENGIKDINIDLIYGLPGQTIELFKKDLDIATSLPITHISSYSLMVNEHTKFFIDGIKEKDDDEVRKYYDTLVEYLKKKNIYRYEVSNFSKKGYESQHNLIYWRNEEYYGVGAGASGYLGNERYTNTKSINKYIEGNWISKKEIVTKEDKEFYRIMLGLRLEEGIIIENSPYKEKAELLVKKNLLEKKEDKFKVKDENLFILDFILRELLY